MARPFKRLASLYGSLFHKPQKEAVDGYFQTFTAYSPSFTTWAGGIYEAELTRSVIESGAEHAGKLKPEIAGVAAPRATASLALAPNPWQTTPQFLRRIWTILEVNDTCVIVPWYDSEGIHAGYWPLLPRKVSAVDVDGELWLQMIFSDGQERLIPWTEAGVLTRHQYQSDLFGDGADVLRPTLALMSAQNQAEQAAIERNGQVTFIGKIGQVLSDKDRKKVREEFNSNLSASNAGGIAIYDNRFDAVQQVTPQHYTVDTAQMERIEKAVYRHFGSNESVVTNGCTEDEWNMFYEGRIEPFAVQLGAVLTRMTFTPREIACGNAITFSANRLEFASNRTKLDVALGLFDRGIWCGNQVAEVFQSPAYDGGDKHVIRGEYIDLDKISEHTVEDANAAASSSKVWEGTNASET